VGLLEEVDPHKKIKQQEQVTAPDAPAPAPAPAPARAARRCLSLRRAVAEACPCLGN
jgi:hypothetical protein